MWIYGITGVRLVADIIFYSITWLFNCDYFYSFLFHLQVLLTRGNLPAALELMSKAAELAPTYAIAVATKWYVQYRILGGSGDMGGE